jgi:hypothetical protein
MSGNRLRVLLVSMLAVFAVSAVASATAQAACSGTAPEHKCIWEIKETIGGAFEELETGEEANTPSNETTTFTLTAGTIVVTCTHVTGDAIIKGGKPGTDLAKFILFTGCTVNKANCKIKSKGNTKAGEILVTDIHTTLLERSKGATNNILADNFEQKTKHKVKEFVTLETGEVEKLEEEKTRFEHRVLTTACSGIGTPTKVTGSVAAKVEAEKLNFPSPELSGNTLNAFGVAAKLEGTVKVPLEEPGEYRAS